MTKLGKETPAGAPTLTTFTLVTENHSPTRATKENPNRHERKLLSVQVQDTKAERITGLTSASSPSKLSLYSPFGGFPDLCSLQDIFV